MPYPHPLWVPLLASVALLDDTSRRPFSPRFRLGVFALGVTMLLSILGSAT